MKLQQQKSQAKALRRIKQAFSVLLSMGLFAGCATPSTIQSREQERAAACASFSPEVKALVNQGRIQAGMTTDAVYVAWGPPTQVLQSGNQQGVFTTWVYLGNFLEETRFWAGRRYPYLAHDYEPRTYVRAEIVFANGLVQSWSMLPQPAY